MNKLYFLIKINDNSFKNDRRTGCLKFKKFLKFAFPKIYNSIIDFYHYCSTTYDCKKYVVVSELVSKDKFAVAMAVAYIYNENLNCCSKNTFDQVEEVLVPILIPKIEYEIRNKILPMFNLKLFEILRFFDKVVFSEQNRYKISYEENLDERNKKNILKESLNIINFDWKKFNEYFNNNNNVYYYLMDLKNILQENFRKNNILGKHSFYQNPTNNIGERTYIRNDDMINYSSINITEFKLNKEEKETILELNETTKYLIFSTYEIDLIIDYEGVQDIHFIYDNNIEIYLKKYIKTNRNLVAIGDNIVTRPEDNTKASFYINYYYGVKLKKLLKDKLSIY